jgi:hypothetical protein
MAAMAGMENMSRRISVAKESTTVSGTTKSALGSGPMHDPSSRDRFNRKIISEDMAWNATKIQKLSDLCVGTIVNHFQRTSCRLRKWLIHRTTVGAKSAVKVSRTRAQIDRGRFAAQLDISDYR